MKRLLVVALATSMLVASGQAIGQGKGNSKPAPLVPLAYYDDNDVLVGRFVHLSNQENDPPFGTLISWGTEFLPIPVYNYGAGDAWFGIWGQVRYTDPDCTGVAYLDFGYPRYPIPGLPNRSVAVSNTPQGTILFVSAAVNAAQPVVTFRSNLDGNGRCTNGDYQNAFPPLEAIVNLSAKFVRPLKLK